MRKKASYKRSLSNKKRPKKPRSKKSRSKRNLKHTPRTSKKRGQMERRKSTRGSVAAARYPETRIYDRFRSVIAADKRPNTNIDKICTYFEKKNIPYVILPDKIIQGKHCIVISEDHTHAGFFDGESLWNSNDEPGSDGTNNGDGFDDLKMKISPQGKGEKASKTTLIASVPRGFTRCKGPGKSHNMQGLALDSKGHIIPDDMLGKVTDEGGQCFLLALGYYQYAVKQKKDLCEIVNKSHVDVMELAEKIFKRDLRI